MTESIRIRVRDVAAILGISKTTVWLWAKTKPAFPAPRRDGARCTYWLRSEVEAYARGESGVEVR